MENTPEKEYPEKETHLQENYIPRPAWQVWCARIALVIFILLLIGQLINLAKGGL